MTNRYIGINTARVVMVRKGGANPRVAVLTA
jgi:hypothetical protein